jgi:nicotinamidase-related amidase
MPDTFAIDQRSTCVLLMDFQNEIVDMIPATSRPVLDNAAAVLAKAREVGLTVIHIVVRFREG